MFEPGQVIAGYPPHRYTLNSLLAARAARAGGREFLVYGESTWSYSQALASVARVASVLHGRGVRSGQRVAVMSLNHPSTVFVFIALARLRAVMVPINPEFRAEEARYVLSHAEVSGVVCSPAALTTVREALAPTQLRPWLMLNEQATTAVDTDLPVLEVDIRESSVAAPVEDEAPDDPCVFIYTSGTTGFPKGVMHSQRNVVLAGEGFVQRMYLQPDDRLMCILPMFHVNALFYSLSGALAAGAALVLIARFSASRSQPF
jgi:carnitine-CoA ligase